MYIKYSLKDIYLPLNWNQRATSTNPPTFSIIRDSFLVETTRDRSSRVLFKLLHFRRVISCIEPVMVVSKWPVLFNVIGMKRARF